ncbi:MAG TPA: PQQ-binding-like beta-propeller repeat protein [Bryobacteraceae bacterium]|nr:PQQ-binding-like beta-propeller repeat protein [Bryobacteraceae bacterium]
MKTRRELLLALSAAAAGAQTTRKTGTAPRSEKPAPQPDWPQWHGPDRTNLSRETGLLKQWPQGGPKLLWSTRGLGTGYGTVAIQGNRIYVQGAKGGKSVALGLDRADGRILWTAPVGRALDQDRGGGPRSTPTVNGENIYVLTENGDLACIRDKDSHIVWNRNILADYNGRNPNWHISESPLIDGNMLVVTPGGRNGGMVAMDKASGKDIWRCTEMSGGAGYASCIVADVHGVRTIMNLTGAAGVGVRASDGKLMWAYEKPANNVANCTTPVYSDNKVFYTSAYGTGCGLLQLSNQGGSIRGDEAYFTRDMQNHHGGVVLVNGHLYGFSNAILTCMNFADGAVRWRDRSVGKGSVTYADGMLYLLGENQQVGLAEATPDGYREKGRFSIEDAGWPSWAHPVVCGGKLYIRNQDTLSCYSVQG